MQKMDRFGDRLGVAALAGDDLSVLLRGGASEIDFGEDLLGEITGTSGDWQKCNNQETGQKFHNFCKAWEMPKGARPCY